MMTSRKHRIWTTDIRRTIRKPAPAIVSPGHFLESNPRNLSAADTLKEPEKRKQAYA
jgi:hypothetical protein